MGPGMTIIFYLEKAGFEAEYDHRTLLLKDFYYGKEGLGMASMLNRGLPCISRHLRPAFGTQLSTNDLSSWIFRILISSSVTLLAVIVSAPKKEVRVYRSIAQNLDLSKWQMETPSIKLQANGSEQKLPLLPVLHMVLILCRSRLPSMSSIMGRSHLRYLYPHSPASFRSTLTRQDTKSTSVTYTYHSLPSG